MGIVSSVYDSNTCARRTCVRFFLRIGTVYSHEADYSLSNACYYNDYTTAKLALECLADVNTGDGFPLFCAIENNNYKLTKLLLDKGAKADIINRQQSKTVYPLAAAILTKNREPSMNLDVSNPDERVKIVDLLLSYDAIPDRKKIQIYLLELLAKQNNPTITRLVMEKIDMSHHDIDYPKLIEIAVIRDNHNTAGFIRSFYERKKNPNRSRPHSTSFGRMTATSNPVDFSPSEYTPLVSFKRQIKK